MLIVNSESDFVCIVTAITHTDTGTERERERERERSLTETEAYRGVIRGFGVWFIFIFFCVKVYWVLILFKEWIRMEVYNSSSNYL